MPLVSATDRSPDRYVVKKVLGEGGAGRVSLVEDRQRPGRDLALKELLTADAPRHVDAFRREFATLACLHHPNLVEVVEFDASPASGLPRFTLEFIAGRNIVDAVRAEGPGLFLDLVAESLRAVAFLHELNLLHRDLKPANLLVRDRAKLGCRLVLVDFGLVLDAESSVTAGAPAAGTLTYLAPEVLENQAASRRSDLYALGAVFHEVVYGSPPANVVESASGTFVRESGRRATTPAPLPPDYPPGLASWFAELLASEPERRPASAAEALARLNEACRTTFPAETAVTRAARLLSGPPAEREATVVEIRGCLAPSSAPRVVWVCGGPGSGKSRILRWLEAEAVLRGWNVVAALGRFDGDLAALRRSAERQPTLALIDETESAAPETIEMIQRVAREGAAPPVQIVAALRTGAIAHPVLGDLVRSTGTVPTLRRVDLPRLDQAGARAMARRASGGDVADDKVSWLAEESGGSPALAESLLIEGVWERGRREAAIRSPAPWARLELISPSAVSWLTCLAVLRKRIRDRHATALSGLDAPSARAVSDEAVAAGLAYRKDGRWFLDSGALGDQLLSSIAPERRRELHRVAAELLEGEAGDDDHALRALLWSEAGERGKSRAEFARAAERSERAGDPAGAASQYADALRTLGRTREGRAALRRKQCESLMRAGMNAAAVRASGAAVRFAGDDAGRIEAFNLRALALAQGGRFTAALEVASRAADRSMSAGDAAGLARARTTAGIALGRLGREAEAIPLLTEARAIFEERGDSPRAAEALHALAACRARLQDPGAEGDFTAAIALYDRAIVPGAPSEGQDLKARIGLAVMRGRSGRYDEAAALLEAVRIAAAARGHLAIQEVALSKLVVNAIDTGKLDRAIALAGQAADLAVHLGDHNLIVVNRCGLADALIRCGRAGEAAAVLRASLAAPVAQVEPEIVDYTRMLLADALMESGAPDDEARPLLAQSLAGCRERRKGRALLMALVIEMERTCRPDGVGEFEPLRSEYEVLVSAETAPIEPEIGIRAALAASSFHRVRGDAGAARALATDAAGIARDRGSLAFEARSLAVLALSLDRQGKTREADDSLHRGHELLQRAAERIEDAAIRADFLDRPVYAALRENRDGRPGRGDARLATLYDMIRVLNSEPDAERLLETILDLALRAVDAERGLVFLREDREGPGQGEFSVHLSRNLESETVRDAEAFSRRIVEAAGQGKSLLALDAGTDDRFRDLASVSLYQIRSLMCVPLRSRGRVIGTVYLDSRKDGRLFTQDDLRFVEAFADQAALAIENTRMRSRLERENRQLAEAAEARTSFARMVGRSPGIRAVFRLIEKVAATDLPVLIRGESGTGKELVARAIHAHGPRRRKPFLAENCAALPEALLEAELFGHVRGAFTGAERNRPGLFEQATGGTLFLDEVGDMSPAMQVRLLRVVEDGVIRRVGAEKPLPVDVRLVTATHRDLQKEIGAGRFRLDLLYRLQVLTIEIPPLRSRPGDIPLLVAHVLERIAAERGRPPCTVDDEAMGVFERHVWPGNVRELQNTLQRLSLLAGERAITAKLIDSDPALRRTLFPEREGEQQFSLRAGEKSELKQAIAAAAGNRKKAAELLGISRATLYRKLRHHGM